MEWVKILGCPITKLPLEDFLTRIDEFIASKKPHYIAVVNVAKLVKMRSDKELEQSILAADLVGADGLPLVWVSRLFGTPLPGRVTGIDLMYKLLELANGKGYRIFFLGAKEKVLQAVVQKIRMAQADLLFIAFGTPKKELWVKRYLHTMGIPVVHGVGGSFDVLAGLVPRAPLWMQRNGLEWLFRLLQEPRRMWRRYLVTNAVFIFLIFRELIRHQLPSVRGTPYDLKK
jgi:N-acetylglucosaminyldiphosphoundecaprenol N-acetyl-beta-D-mannosaminyltransferase